MAQYTVTAGCGHTSILQLAGPTVERNRRIAWMESPAGMCNPCYAAHKRAADESVLQREIDVLMAQMRAQPRPTVEQIAAVRAQIEAGQGSAARREAVRRYLIEIGA